MTSILFVCLANICRSPALEATLRHLAVKKNVVDRFRIDSCGLGWFHVGEHSDPRMFEEAKKRGILIDHRAQQFQMHHFAEFDHILGVDDEVVAQLKKMATTTTHRKKVQLVTDFSSKYKGQSIPDPYYMNENGFAEVMDIVVDCCEGILGGSRKSEGRRQK